MPPRNHNNNNHRGGDRGRGRGRGQGQGRGRGQGQGRGGSHRGIPTTASPAEPSAHPRHPYPHTNAEFDVDVQKWPDTRGDGNRNRGVRPGKGGTPASRSGAGTPSRATEPPRRGGSTPKGPGRGKGKGRGRGHGGANDPTHSPRRPYLGIGGGRKAKTILGKDAPLSDQLYSARPLLRPVKFVRATLTPLLFQQSEDVLKPATEVADTTDASHVPTADRVAELFRGSAVETTSDSGSDSEDNALDVLEEVDFTDLAEVRAEVDAIAQGTVTAMMASDTPAEEHIEEVDFADLAAIRAEVDAIQIRSTPQDVTIEETFTGMYRQIKQAAQASSITEHVEEDKRHVSSLQEPPSSSVSAVDNLKASIEISNPSESNHDLGTVLVEEESSSPLQLEEPPVSTPHHVAVPTSDTPLHPDAPYSHPIFVVDTTPTRPVSCRSASDVILVDRTGHGDTLGDQEEERIVYIAPHPRSGRASPIPAVPRVKLPKTTSILTGRVPEVGRLRSPVREDGVPDRECVRAEEPSLSLASLTLEPAASESVPVRPTRTNVTAAMRVRKKDARRQRQRDRQNKHHQLRFGAYGTMLSEARLREENTKEKRRPRWETRRKGDSDVEWGTVDEDEDEEEVEGRDRAEMEDEADPASDSHGMEIDPDLVMDLDAMRGFVKSMSAKGSQYVTMDDIEDEARLVHEDEEGYGGSDGSSASDDEEEEVDKEEEEKFHLEEEKFIAESDCEFSEDSDNDLSPTSSFKMRLLKIRERSRSQDPTSVQERSDDEEDAPKVTGVSQRDIEALLDDPEFTTPVSKKKKDKKKDKGKQTGHFAPELAAQWAKDRAKKAEYKHAREQARLLAALDPLSPSASGSGSGSAPKYTSRKAMQAAARLEPSTALALTPHALTAMDSTDMKAIEGLIRRFVSLGVPSMPLPAMPKEVRKGVHEMAAVFGVGSKSKGKGKGRYTMLYRTGRTGVGVKEGRVRALVDGRGGRGGGGGGRGGKGGGVPKHKEGDEVGKEAPKIGQGNVGFRMLASMGWSEGDKIGGSASGGIEAPLTAIIKNSKLGLGATR